MAGESLLLHLLFSLSGIRSLYSRYMQGPNAVQSEGELRTRLSETFLTSPQDEIADVAARFWRATSVADSYNQHVFSVQMSSGGQWPSAVTGGSVPESQELAPFADAPSIPGFSIPSVSDAGYVIQGLVHANVIYESGEQEPRTVQVIGAYSNIPTMQDIITDFVDQATTIIETGTRRTPQIGQVVIDTTTLQPELSVEFMTMIQTIAGD